MANVVLRLVRCYYMILRVTHKLIGWQAWPVDKASSLDVICLIWQISCPAAGPLKGQIGSNHAQLAPRGYSRVSSHAAQQQSLQT